ncbi:MAG: Fe-S cluster assembly protein SufD [Gammaproteobacteria bacterium]
MNTNIVIQAQDHYAAEFERLAAGLAGSAAAWLRELRQEAMTRFCARGFPVPRDEDWKYTRTAAIEKRFFNCSAAGEIAVDMERIDNSLQVEAAAQRLVFINGRYFPALSRLDALPAGAAATSLHETLRRHPDELQGLLGSVADMDRHPFAALNTAFADDGVYLRLAPGTVVEQPLHVVFFATVAQEGRVSHPRVLVHADDNSHVVLVERHIAFDDTIYFSNVLSEIRLGKNAAVDYYRLQEESAKAFHISGVHVHQDRDSRFDAHTVTLGSALVRNDVDVRLAAPGAHCELNGLYLVNGRQHVDTHTRIDHLQPHGTSNEFYKGIVDGRGRSVFNGKVLVHPGAQKTDARQSNKNLLLSIDAEADTKPELEIYADDVKCSHGATVGQLDADAVFYLRSRGIPEAAARNLLTLAFAQEIIEQVKVPALRSCLDQAVMQRLPQDAWNEGLL